MRPRANWSLTLAAVAAAALALGACSSSSSTVTGTAPPAVEATSAGPATAPHCGVERWAVKTGTDPAASSVDLSRITDTSVAALGALPIPSGWSQDAGRLPNSAEDQVWRVHAILVKYKMEADSDYHLVLQSSDGATMIAEIPAPACVGDGSPFAAAITHARKQFDAVFAPGDFWQPAGVPVIVTGVGFFDALHGQTGVARNGVELHPVTDIQIMAPVPAGSASASPTATGGPASIRHLRLGERAPECVTVKIKQPAGNVWLAFCGSGPGRESSMRDNASPQIVDGFAALIPPADCTAPGTQPGPCVLFATASGPS